MENVLKVAVLFLNRPALGSYRKQLWPVVNNNYLYTQIDKQ